MIICLGKLWTAPELLRETFPPPRGTQKGDIYSFAIISCEIVEGSQPYNLDKITPRGKYSTMKVPKGPTDVSVKKVGYLSLEEHNETYWEESIFDVS